jgi:hypothetical protein
MKIARMLFAIVLAFFVFGLLGKGFAFLIGVAGSFFISSERGHDNLDGAANILGLLGGLYVWITREEVEPAVVSQ